jgi:hypothetical protein
MALAMLLVSVEKVVEIGVLSSIGHAAIESGDDRGSESTFQVGIAFMLAVLRRARIPAYRR